MVNSRLHLIEYIMQINSNILCSINADKLLYELIWAQRLVAQALGRFRCVVTILTGILKSQSSVFSLSLGQVG
jgi:hypothetical protein